MKIYVYARVSSREQTIENQRFEIANWCSRNNLEIDSWTVESISGTIAWEKRKLGRLLRKMSRGDLLICTEISRLGRNMLMIMSILNYCSSKGIGIRTIKDGFNLSDNISSRILAFAFALAAEIERNLISQRTREALAAKKAAGVRLGRPSGPSRKVQIMLDDLPKIRARVEIGESKSSIAREYGVHRNTIINCLKEGQ